MSAAFGGGLHMDVPQPVLDKYEINGVCLGSGSFGQVKSGRARATGRLVAFKLIRNVFHSAHDARRVLREISIMRQCNHPNLMALVDVFTANGGQAQRGAFRDVCLVMPNGGHDLARVLAAAHRLEAWGSAHVKFFMWQLLCALQYLHSANIAHRDLKPGNILVNDDNHLTLIDFGLARQLSGRGTGGGGGGGGGAGGEPPARVQLLGADARSPIPASPPAMARSLTKHVVTRWYRAPEIVLQNERYSDAIDLWAAGCIYAELLETLEPAASKPKPLFPGRTSLQSDPHRYCARPAEILNDPDSQINRIFQVIGTPTSTECSRVVTDEKVRQLLATVEERPRVRFEEIFPSAAKEDIFVLNHTLQFDPKRRFSAAQLLHMVYWDDVRDLETEKLGSAHIDCQFEDEPIPSAKADPRHERARAMIRREIELCFFPGDRVAICNGTPTAACAPHSAAAAATTTPAAATATPELLRGYVVSCEGSRATVNLDWYLASGFPAVAHVGLEMLVRCEPGPRRPPPPPPAIPALALPTPAATAASAGDAGAATTVFIDPSTRGAGAGAPVTGGAVS